MTQHGLPDQPGALPDAPTPWAASTMPPTRSGPPFLMTEMITAEPGLARRLLARLVSDPALPAVASAVRAAAHRGKPIIVTGCGTSDHAAQGSAAILGEALERDGGALSMPVSRQAFEVALDPPLGGLLIAISHEGATWATNRAIEAARASGATTALLTVSDRAPGATLADVVVATHELDQSWCHTVAYVSPMLVAAALSARLAGSDPEPADAARLLAAGLERSAGAEEVAAALSGASHVLVVGSGVDRTSAAELALKIEEGAHLPATARDVETILHGHLAAVDPSMALVLLLTDPRRRAERAARGRDVLAAAAAIGMPAAAIVTADVDAVLDLQLTPAGRIVCPEDAGIPGVAGALLGSAVPLQLLAERLARARGTNPDTIGREESVYAEAAARAERA